jgi:hypothetical protein
MPRKSPQSKPAYVTIVVLNDGETYSDIAGCSLCVVPMKQYESVIAAGGDARDFQPVVEIGLHNDTCFNGMKVSA